MNKLNYQEKLKEVERILESNGYDRNSWQVFQKDDSKIEIGSYSGIILNFLEVYQSLFNVNDDELLNYFKNNGKLLIETIMDSNFRSFKEFIEPNCEVEKIDIVVLRQILNSLSLSRILKRVVKNRESCKTTGGLNGI